MIPFITAGIQLVCAGALACRNRKNYITIITVGGSTTECKFLSDNETWPEPLKSDLKKDHPGLSG
jgi:hypothetical protein